VGARLGNQIVLAARRAVHAEETSREDATLEECAKLTSHEERQTGPCVVVLDAVQERVEMSGQHTVEHGFLRLATLANRCEQSELSLGDRIRSQRFRNLWLVMMNPDRRSGLTRRSPVSA